MPDRLVLHEGRDRRGLGRAPPNGSASGPRCTRFTFSADSSSTWARSSSGTPVASSAFTSMCPASHGTSSAGEAREDVDDAPRHAAEVASTSPRETAGSGNRRSPARRRNRRCDDCRRHARHEPEERLVRRRDDPHHAGGLRDLEVEVRTRHRVRVHLDLMDLVGRPRVPDRSGVLIAALTPRAGSLCWCPAAPVRTVRRGFDGLPLAATRYRIWARFDAVFAAHPVLGGARRPHGVAEVLDVEDAPRAAASRRRRTPGQRPDALRGSCRRRTASPSAGPASAPRSWRTVPSAPVQLAPVPEV